MPAAQYSCYVDDPFGTRLADVSGFISLKYSRVVNDISSLVLVLPGNFDTNAICIPDGRIEVWRRLPDSSREYLDTETTWLIKTMELSTDDSGKETIVIEADHPLCLLKEPGRIVDYAAGSSQADQTDQLDDMMKAIIRQNLGTSATDNSRNLSAYLSVAPDLGLAPSTNKAFAWKSVLKVLQDLAATSAQSGTYLAFDMVAPSPDTFEFRTYTQQRGVDHRFPSGQNPVIVGRDFGNMGAASLKFDYRNEVTWARAGGQGDGTNRNTATAQDSTRIGVSPFGRREAFVQATQYVDDTSGGLTAEAQAEVRNGRPRTIFRGKLLDTEDTRYGVHWGWGDFVTAQYKGYQIDCRVDAVTVSVKAGGSYETIEALLRNDQ